MKKYLLTAFVLTVIKLATAQSFQPTVVSSSGTFGSSSSGSMAWSVGEVMCETYSSTNTFFTQGFHQPFQLVVTLVTQPITPNILIYPNPVTDNLIIDLSGLAKNFNIEIFDMQGKLLYADIIGSGNKSIISFREFAPGTYLLNISNTKSNQKSSYKITK